MTFLSLNNSFLIKRVLWYALAFLAIWYFEKNFKSGPCAPNLDIFAWFSITVLSLIFLLKNVVQLIVSKESTRIYTTSLHAIAFLLLCLWGNL
jgi:hypothetical protein